LLAEIGWGYNQNAVLALGPLLRNDQPCLNGFSETDFVRQQVAAGSIGVNQFVSYLGGTVLPVRGLMIGLAYERFQENLSVNRTGHNAFDAQINFFPWAHIELVVIGRYQMNGWTAGDGPSNKLLMGQLHYYL